MEKGLEIDSRDPLSADNTNCSFHPGNESVENCLRCLRFICEQCMHDVFVPWKETKEKTSWPVCPQCMGVDTI